MGCFCSDVLPNHSFGHSSVHSVPAARWAPERETRSRRGRTAAVLNAKANGSYHRDRNGSHATREPTFDRFSPLDKWQTNFLFRTSTIFLVQLDSSLSFTFERVSDSGYWFRNAPLFNCFTVNPSL